MQLPFIHGRQVVPIRALPFLTQFRPLSPDTIATLFSGDHPFHRWGLKAYRVADDGKVFELLPRHWDAVGLRINAELVRIRRTQLSEEEGDVEWELRALELLPAGAFVWREELEVQYKCTFGATTFISEQPGAPSRDPHFLRVMAALETGSEGQIEADMAAFDAAATRAIRVRHGDGQLEIDQTAEPDRHLKAIIFEGFEESPRLDELASTTQSAGTVRHQLGQTGRKVYWYALLNDLVVEGHLSLSAAVGDVINALVKHGHDRIKRSETRDSIAWRDANGTWHQISRASVSNRWAKVRRLPR